MSDVPPDTGEQPPAPDPEPTPSVDELLAEVEKWKTQSRKHEDRAKANANAAKELDQVRQQSMTDTERAVEAAKADALSIATKAFGGKLVAAEVKAAAAGRELDVDTLLEGLDASRFLGDDGDPDVTAINEWVDRLAPKGEARPAPLDLGQGNRGRENTPLGSDPLLDLLRGGLGIKS